MGCSNSRSRVSHSRGLGEWWEQTLNPYHSPSAEWRGSPGGTRVRVTLLKQFGSGRERGGEGLKRCLLAVGDVLRLASSDRFKG